MSTDQPNGSALPAQPGTEHDGDPYFEAIVFGFVCSTKAWNGEHQGPDSPAAGTETRAALAGYFEQYLAQMHPELGQRVQYGLRSGLWLHGEVIEVGLDWARVRWDDGEGKPSEHVGRFDADHFDMLVREPKARVL